MDQYEAAFPQHGTDVPYLLEGVETIDPRLLLEAVRDATPKWDKLFFQQSVKRQAKITTDGAGNGNVKIATIDAGHFGRVERWGARQNATPAPIGLMELHSTQGGLVSDATLVGSSVVGVKAEFPTVFADQYEDLVIAMRGSTPSVDFIVSIQFLLAPRG